mmetsp:Transcript_92963/g.245488  ORF Transcript_92963/g.245488 Transcript_92963/m.245488 type:complete len:348 (-) Transcript_92963:23-1066(-)
MAEASAAAALAKNLEALEQSLQKQEEQHASELKSCRDELSDLHKLVLDLESQASRLEVVGRGGPDQFVRRVEWTISEFSQKEQALSKGESIWSPKFRAAGLDGLQLEFFPKGREKTTFEGFCSLFLWCPSGTKIRYQLWVGNFLRAPDEDEYTDRIGHGHSNFCPASTEVNRQTDSICVGVDLLEVQSVEEISSSGLRLISKSLESMVSREVEVIRNGQVTRAVWKIRKISEMLKQLPRGASMWSPLFTAAGIREILLEFYPKGSTNTTKDGYCAFYIRCPEGVSMVVTLFVGKSKKGPIKTTFDSLTGKGLPDYCSVQDEINMDDDSLEVGIELKNQPSSTLSMES